MSNSPWFCCQLGAREHYAIPRALWSMGRLERLLTDAWSPSLPDQWKLPVLAGKWQSRRHADLAQAPVSAFTGSLLAFELRQRMRGRRGWERIIARSRWFERQAVGALEALPEPAGRNELPPVLFAYSYAALDILRFARSRGWRTVLGQIDPGRLEEEIVRQEHERHPALQPGWRPAPAPYWRRWEEECEAADRIVVNSPWALDALRRQNVPEAKLSVIPLAFEASAPLPSPKAYPARFSSARPLRVLFLGQIGLRKGIARLLGAAEALAGEPVEVWLAGPVQINRAAIPQRAKPLLRWLGPVAREAAAACYRAADVFILPTLSDGFALTQLEALAQRLPVIASLCCGPAVRDGINGLLLPEASAQAIAEAVRACLREPERLREFSRAAGIGEEHALSTLGRRFVGLSGDG